MTHLKFSDDFVVAEDRHKILDGTRYLESFSCLATWLITNQQRELPARLVLSYFHLDCIRSVMLDFLCSFII